MSDPLTAIFVALQQASKKNKAQPFDWESLDKPLDDFSFLPGNLMHPSQSKNSNVLRDLMSLFGTSKSTITMNKPEAK